MKYIAILTVILFSLPQITLSSTSVYLKSNGDKHSSIKGKVSSMRSRNKHDNTSTLRFETKAKGMQKTVNILHSGAFKRSDWFRIRSVVSSSYNSSDKVVAIEISCKHIYPIRNLGRRPRPVAGVDIGDPRRTVRCNLEQAKTLKSESKFFGRIKVPWFRSGAKLPKRSPTPTKHYR